MAILDVGPYRCLKICNLRFVFSSYTNKVKLITISLWASDSYGKWQKSPHSLWAITLADVKRGFFERDVPGVEKSWY